VEVIHCVDSFDVLNRRGGSAAGHRRGWVERLEGKDGVIVHPLRSRAGWLSPLATYLTGQPLFKRSKIPRILRNGNFDVIHYHNISLVGGRVVLAMGKAVKLYTIHEHWLLYATDVYFRYNRALCTRRTCARCQLLLRHPIQLWRPTPLLPLLARGTMAPRPHWISSSLGMARRRPWCG
jgi:hypothetical protein